MKFSTKKACRIKILISIFLINSVICKAQFIPDRCKNLYQIKAEKVLYFDSLRTTIGDSLFYREGSDYNEYMKWLLYWEPRLFPHGDMEIYSHNNREAEIQLSNSFPNFRSSHGNNVLFNNTPWKEIGPIHRPENGINWIASGGCDRGVGPVEFISIYQNNPVHMLCGSNAGGLFYSDDAGLTWHNGGSDLQWNYSGCAFAMFHPSNPNIWYASNYATSLTYSKGIYRTYDHGQNWNKIGDYNSLANGFWNGINKMVLDFNHPDDVMYVAMTDGLFKSNDLFNANPTYNKLSDPLIDGNINDLQMKTNDNNFLVATVLDNNNPKHWHAVYTQNAGTTWSTIANYPVLIDFVPEGGGLTIETTNANSNYFYFLIDDNSSHAKIFRWDQSNGAWTDLSDASGHTITMGSGHGFCISQILADDIYVSQDIRYKTRISGLWTNYPDYVANVYEYHVDVEDFVGHPTNSGEVWMACHGGVYKSVNNGANWTNMSEGIGIAEVLRMSTSVSNPGYLLIGTFHDGTIRTDPPYNSTWNPLWRTVYGGDGMTPIIDYSDESHMWASTQNYMVRSDNYGIENSFSSFANNWTAWAISGVLNTQHSDWQYSTGTTTQFPGRTEIMLSKNRGNNRYPISNFNLVSGMTTYLTWHIFASPSNSDYLYAHVLDYYNGSSNPPNHRLFRTKSANINSPQSTFEELSIPRNSWIGDLQVSEENPDQIYICYTSDDSNFPNGNSIIYKVDYTLSSSAPIVTNITKNLPYIGLGWSSMALEKGTDGGVYLASDQGVFYSNNKLLNDPSPTIGWNFVGVDLPHVAINGIEINYVENKLRVGTMGRGVWENDLYCPDNFDLTEINTYSTDQFIEAQNSIMSNSIINSGLKVRYRFGEEVTLKDGFHANAGSDFKTIFHPCNHPGNSFKYSSLSDVVYDDDESSEKNDLPEVHLYPNPGNTEVKFDFYLENDEQVSAKVYNCLGYEILNVYKKELVRAGKQTESVKKIV